VFHVPTNVRAERTLTRAEVPLWRISWRLFATMLGLMLLLLVTILIWVLSVLVPPQTPLAARQDLAPVYEAILAHRSGAVVDPLIALAPGVDARASNLRGFSLGATTYYYYVEGEPGFDPYSRGAVSADQIELLLRDVSGPTPLVIYRLR
jgi:hypothetical protein